MPTWRNLKTFAIGIAWAFLSAAAPVTLTIWDTKTNWVDQDIDWAEIRRLTISCGVVGAVGYWRKHKALLAEPPADNGTPPTDLAKGQGA